MSGASRSGPVWGVVVARVGAGAKSRLGRVLTAEQRTDLALAMLDDVLRVCTASPLLAGVVAVIDTDAARAVALAAGALAVPDPGQGDMNAAVQRGIGTVLAHGAETVVVLPADIPLLESTDLARVLQAAEGQRRAVVIGASQDSQGTNALLLQPPDVMTPSFGPPSVERHRLLARASGVEARIVADLGLSIDIDLPADLDRLRGLRPGQRTAAVVAALGELQVRSSSPSPGRS